MSRYFTTGCLLLAFLVLSGCQQRTAELVQTKARADEAMVVSNLRMILGAQQSYHVSFNRYGTFMQLLEDGYLNVNFAREKPVIGDYAYSMTVSSDGTSYACNADPAGDREGKHFYIDSNSTDIRVNATKSATSADEIINP